MPVTLRRLKQLFAWQGMKTQVHTFVQSCLVCQQAKPDRAKLPGLLQPIPVPNGSWQVVTMDFIEGLPRSGELSSCNKLYDKHAAYTLISLSN